MFETGAVMVTETDSPRQRLLATAIEIFADKGFAAAAVRDICKGAGVNIAAINYYFGDKERLYIEAVKAAHTCMSDAVPLPEWSEDTPPLERLRDFIAVMVARMFQEPNPHATQLIMRELATPTAACAEMVNATIRPMADMLRGILSELLPHADELQRYLAGFSIVGQCLFYKQNRPIVQVLLGEEHFAALNVRRIADHIIDLTLHGLRVEGMR